MFEKKKILTCTIVFAIIIASFIYIEQLKEYSPFPNEVKVTTLKTQEIRSLHEKSIPPLEASFKNNVLIKVFRKNGEIETYFKKDDPWVLNLPKLIMNILLGGFYGGTSSAFTFEDGSTGTMIDTEGDGTNPTFLIGIGNGTAAFSVTDYRLSNKITLISVPSTAVAFSDNGTCYNLNATASYTASSTKNITETGLFIVVDKAYSGVTNVNLMLARNKLASNITLNSGDTISIAYVLYFPYGKPFTKQFYGLMLNYFFGLRAYGKQISFTTTSGTSTPYDDMWLDAAGPRDAAQENLYFVLGSASTIWNYTVYNLRTQIAISASPTPFTFSYNSTHAILKNSVTYSFSSSATVQEVGFLIKSIDINWDTSSTDAYTLRDVLVMYFNLTSPINIPAGGTFKFNCTIYIRLV
jgi:hypothetical protein